MKPLTVKICIVVIMIITVTTFFFACKKTDVSKGDPVPVILVTASISGQVTDLNNVPISNAAISAGTANTTTDINGRFTIKNTKLNKEAGLVKVTMNGYFNGSRTFLTTTNSVNNIKIQLIPKTVSGNFATASGGNVNVTGGGTVSFSTGNVVTASNGAAYTGNVNVPAYYLNPAASNFNEFMPGDLRSIASNDQKGILKTFGMASIEMDAASGEKLQLASGKTATITLPIPSAMQSTAPSSIPLWYFDETNGYWTQQGSATKQGNNYVGTVSHFSFWSVGQLAQSVKLTATLKLDTTGMAFANKLVTLSRSDSTSTDAYTDSTGTVSGLVPSNETLTMEVFNDCGDNVYSTNIGPFSADTTIGNIIIPANDCFPADLTQFINLSFNGNNYFWPSYHIRQSLEPGLYTTIIGGSPSNISDVSTYCQAEIFGGVTSVGSYPVGLYVIVNGSVTYQAGGLSYDPSYFYPITTITKYDAINGYIEGTISGWIKTFPSIPTADSFALTGNYRVKRIQ